MKRIHYLWIRSTEPPGQHDNIHLLASSVPVFSQVVEEIGRLTSNLTRFVSFTYDFLCEACPRKSLTSHIFFV